MSDVEILADINYNFDCTAVFTQEITTVTSPISNTASSNTTLTPVTQDKANRAASSGSDGTEKQTENGVAATQTIGDRVSLSQTSVQLSTKPSEGSIQSADEAARVVSNLKELISNNPGQAIAAQSGS